MRKQRGIFEKVPGSGLWWVRYADHRGKLRREKIGSRSAAIRLYAKRKSEVLQGKKLPETRRRRPLTLGELAQDALVYCRQRHRSYRNDPPQMARFLAWWKDRPAESITPGEIEQRLSQVGWADATFNRARALLSLTYNLGIRHEKVSANPVRLVPPRRERNVRTGFVDDAQYGQLTRECPSLWLRALLALGYTYGWRKGELLSLRVKQVNLLEHNVRLEPGTTKNEDGRTVKLTRECYELVKACITGKDPDDYVFTREEGSPVRSFYEAWADLCVRVGLGRFLCRRCGTPAKPCPECSQAQRSAGYKYEGLIFHDLRRSAVRNLERAGVPRSVAMKMTGHKTEAVYQRYAIVSTADLAEATRRLEQSREQLTPELTPALGSDAGNGAKVV